jgi:2,4-diketo-3-deoxy-L-fuconate hydrolase
MKLCRFDDERLGLVEDDMVKDVTAALDTLPAYRVPLPNFDPVIAALDTLTPAILDAAATAAPLPLGSVRLLAPVGNPGKLVAAPVNYRRHFDEVIGDAAIHHGNQIAEIHRAGLFLKATSSLIGPSEPVRIRHADRRNDHEIELAAIIGRRGSNIPRDEALSYVAGYAIGLDMTLRGPEERSLRKSIDSFSVLGPWLVTADELGNPTDLGLHLAVNGETRQQANTRDLILSVAALIEFASSFYTLHPGDVIFTGTPEGVGPVQPGDTLTATIERIGTMIVAVEAA